MPSQNIQDHTNVFNYASDCHKQSHTKDGEVAPLKHRSNHVAH